MGGSREIINAKDIVSELRKQFSYVSEDTFDKKSFKEQVRFMHDHHILISPHGAQLSSVCFMRPCSALLEIFPKYYWVPGALNTLARDAGLFAAYLYLSEHNSPYLETTHSGSKRPEAKE